MTTATNSPVASSPRRGPRGPSRGFVAAALPSAALLLSNATVATGQRLVGPEVEIARGVRLATQSIAGIDDGGFTVAFIHAGAADNGADLFVRSFRPSGEARTGWNRLMRLVPGAVAGPTRLAMQDDRSFMAVWSVTPPGENQSRVLGRCFGDDGTAQGPRFLIARAIAQSFPDVAVTADGGYVVVWAADNGLFDYEGVPAADIRLRRFGADCSPAGPPQIVETGPRDRHTPRVASAPNGDLAIAYVEWQGENTFYDVILQRLDADGTATGPREVVTDGDTQQAFQVWPRLAFAAQGPLLVTWDDEAIDAPYVPADAAFEDRRGVGAQLFAASGSRQGGNQRVNLRPDGAQRDATPLARHDGSFLVLWTSGDDQDGDGDGVYSRAVSPDGLVTGPEERVNLTARGNQAGAVAFSRSSGNGAVVWSSTRTAGGIERLLARTLRPGS